MIWYIFSIAMISIMVAASMPAVLSMARRSRDVKRHGRQHMANRKSASPSEFAKRHFPDHTEAGIKFFKILADNFIVDASKIEPKDRLYEDLRLGSVDGLSPIHLAADVEHAFGFDISNLLECDALTIADVILQIQQKLKERDLESRSII